MSKKRQKGFRSGLAAAARAPVALVAVALVAAALVAVALLGMSSPPGLSQQTPAGGFLTARPGYQYRFPRDHAAHPGLKTEWWYYSGHLKANTGERFGFQLTFFRSGLRPPAKRGGAGASSPKSRWAVRDLYFAHFAVSDHGRKVFHFDERMSRGSLGAAGADTERYRVWLGDWRAEAVGAEKGSPHRLNAEGAKYAIDLTVRPQKPPVIHGLDGTSRKGAGSTQASHYYSLTRMDVRGNLRVIEGRKTRELAVTGTAWMDHEFGSSQLEKDQVGWDWFSFQLENGSEVMLYLMRRKDGTADPYSSGTWIDRDGKGVHLDRKSFRVEVLDTWKSRKSGATYPIRWRVRIPSRRATLRVEPVFPEQEMDTAKSTKVTYWEGSVRIRGKVDGETVRGVGFVEMTGYAGPFRKKI
ncbi:MAG: lipocalin-like domain-containing protein [Nitrospinota bacterium]